MSSKQGKEIAFNSAIKSLSGMFDEDGEFSIMEDLEDGTVDGEDFVMALLYANKEITSKLLSGGSEDVDNMDILDYLAFLNKIFVQTSMNDRDALIEELENKIKMIQEDLESQQEGDVH